jgi:hypothetical protein
VARHQPEGWSGFAGIRSLTDEEIKIVEGE